jgi:hypothetical protein
MVNGRLKACGFAHNFPVDSARSPGREFAAAGRPHKTFDSGKEYKDKLYLFMSTA